jgi:hypothetical protein
LLNRRRLKVEVHVHTEKLAPARMHHFIADQLNDLAVRGKVLSVFVQESAYLVMLSLADRGVTVRRLSPYDVGRSLRGDLDALAVVRADLLRDVPTADIGGLAAGPPSPIVLHGGPEMAPKPPDARDAPATPWRPSAYADRLLVLD